MYFLLPLSGHDKRWFNQWKAAVFICTWAGSWVLGATWSTFELKSVKCAQLLWDWWIKTEQGSNNPLLVLSLRNTLRKLVLPLWTVKIHCCYQMIWWMSYLPESVYLDRNKYRHALHMRITHTKYFFCHIKYINYFFCYVWFLKIDHFYKSFLCDFAKTKKWIDKMMILQMLFVILLYCLCLLFSNWTLIQHLQDFLSLFQDPSHLWNKACLLYIICSYRTWSVWTDKSHVVQLNYCW